MQVVWYVAPSTDQFSLSKKTMQLYQSPMLFLAHATGRGCALAGVLWYKGLTKYG